MQALKGEGQLLESMLRSANDELNSANEERGELHQMVDALQRDKAVRHLFSVLSRSLKLSPS